MDSKPAIQVIEPHIAVFSGGTAFNHISKALSSFTTHVSHILPVSDNGGSTAEIVRVLGGPAVGDIRSRCLRLSDVSSLEARAVRNLLAYRLSSDEEIARKDWASILEGEHQLWKNVSEPYKHTIRAFLVNFQTQILRNNSNSQRFRFSLGSVGNFFFAGARTFFRSIDAAIFLYARVSGIPKESVVLPIIRSEERIAIGAELKDGSKILGQTQISHPPASDASTLVVNKDHDYSPLPSPIHRLFYVSNDGHEIFPPLNPAVVDHLFRANAIIYGIGSLYTSVCPSLILQGIGEAIERRLQIPKILLLNGSLDRETDGMKASDFVLAITKALNRTSTANPLLNPPSAYINTLLYPIGVPFCDEASLHELGVQTIGVRSVCDEKGRLSFVPIELVKALEALF